MTRLAAFDPNALPLDLSPSVLHMKESPIFLKSFETLEWILNHTQKFPKHQRFVMAKRIEEAALAFHDNLRTRT